MTLFYVVALLALFYLLIVAEFFLPTGGFLGVTSVAVLAAAVGVAFSHSVVLGTAVIFFVALTTPMVLFGMLKVWPHTPIGRRMLNRRPGEVAADPIPRTTRRGTPLAELVGRIGKATTDLLPSGQVELDGEKMDAISIGTPIDRGSHVIVVSVETGRVRVRTAVEKELSCKPFEAIPQSPQSLEESLESFDIE
ncbi:MAG: nodulation protein NfeD [Planctomycetaceae bacterium]|nr:nodulation protein NfeD [Planctomycetaceae bacterium]